LPNDRRGLSDSTQRRYERRVRLRITFKSRVLDAALLFICLGLAAQTLLPSPAWAQDSAEFPEDWLTAEGTAASCEVTQARARIVALIEQRQSLAAPLTPQVTLQGDPSGISGEANLTQRDEVVFHKTVTAQNCADVIEALIFSLEIEMERRAIRSASEPPPRKKTKPKSKPIVLLDESPTAPEEGREVWTPMVLAGVLTSSGDLPTGPSGSLGGVLLARVPFKDAWFLTADGRRSQVQLASRGGIEYRFSKMGFHLGPGFAHLVTPGVVLRFDSSLAFHLLKIEVDNPALDTETTIRPSLGSALHGALSISPWRALAIEVRGGATTLFMRRRYVSEQDGVVWRDPWGSLSAGILLGWGGNRIKKPSE
jgi:hypothetical protein